MRCVAVWNEWAAHGQGCCWGNLWHDPGHKMYLIRFTGQGKEWKWNLEIELEVFEWIQRDLIPWQESESPVWRGIGLCRSCHVGVYWEHSHLKAYFSHLNILPGGRILSFWSQSSLELAFRHWFTVCDSERRIIQYILNICWVQTLIRLLVMQVDGSVKQPFWHWSVIVSLSLIILWSAE